MTSNNINEIVDRVLKDLLVEVVEDVDYDEYCKECHERFKYNNHKKHCSRNNANKQDT